ncbi:biotin/lipoyl-containing protein [Gluconacetobacter takamatsuzukensis]|uniref:Biotin carboxyl carrier protein of acetyl-CoA carboxylase n=1 Tax=Gluconacetobacter takamatsuzukensis TaxID=1286190 RepID=A0A7W4PPA6_9PROT|nr:biotin/lipoyl-binding protein [Gluconacetobacter takamatsuzukensis]
MDIQQLRHLIDLLARSPLQELEITEGGQSIRLTRGPSGGTTGAGAGAGAGAASADPAAGAAGSPAPPPQAAPAPPPEAPRIITAPTYGVFHLSPSPGTPPYVAVGQDVQAGQQVGLVEAMKVFNAVKAALSGRVAQILVEDGAEVEAGTPLFRLA